MKCSCSYASVVVGTDTLSFGSASPRGYLKRAVCSRRGAEKRRRIRSIFRTDVSRGLNLDRTVGARFSFIYFSFSLSFFFFFFPIPSFVFRFLSIRFTLFVSTKKDKRDAVTSNKTRIINPIFFFSTCFQQQQKNKIKK